MGEAVFLIVLYELRYPNTQAEVARNLGLIVSSGQPLVSRIITYGMNHMLGRWLHLIQSDGNDHNALAMWNSSAENIVNCVRTKFEGQADQRFNFVAMFIDGTFKFTTKPDQREVHFVEGRDTQRAVYSGYYAGDKFRHLIYCLPHSSKCCRAWPQVLALRVGQRYHCPALETRGWKAP